MSMIILQKCFRITYQTENKQLACSSNFYSRVCLQCSLPACLSPSLPHMCISPAQEAAVPLYTSPARRGRQSTTAQDAKSHLCPQNKDRILHSFHGLPPLSKCHPPRRGWMPSVLGAVPASPPISPVWERMELQQQGRKPAPAQNSEISRSSCQRGMGNEGPPWDEGNSDQGHLLGCWTSQDPIPTVGPIQKDPDSAGKDAVGLIKRHYICNKFFLPL